MSYKYCCVNAERHEPRCTQECMDATLAHEMRWLARHTCRNGKTECGSCRRTIAAIRVLRDWGAKLPSEK